ncbi:MAG: glycerophosphodiester phosphodiesterase [Frondihabitans sp.]|nr:glycerophosphodiester phosphodiesterase [Frondihabitans sp.]
MQLCSRCTPDVYLLEESPQGSCGYLYEVSRVPIVIAHRGASGYRPEHGLDAYRLAIDLGADAIEPDLVATKDGVIVLRHENEISTTTDVESHPDFRDRRTTKEIDGVSVTGWFTEDFTWAELSTLRINERLPLIRPLSAAHDGEGGIVRLADLLALLDSDETRRGAIDGTGVGLVAEIKHATYFESIGLPLDELFVAELAAAGWLDDPRLTVECFEQTVLAKVRARGASGKTIYLLDNKGSAADLVARNGAQAETYAEQLEPDGLARLAQDIDGISVTKKLLINGAGREDPAIVDRAHALGLEVFTWTLRPENRFLSKAFRRGTSKEAFGAWRSEFARVAATGVDGVFVDHPDLALEVLGRETAPA